MSKKTDPRVERNTQLIERAILHIKSLSGDVTPTTVSRATFDIADAAKGEKGIVLSTISKSQIYKKMISEVRESITGKATTTSKSESESAYIIQKLRIELEKKIIENQVLKEEIDKLLVPNGVENTKTDTGKQSQTDVVFRAFVEELIKSGNMFKDHSGLKDVYTGKLYLNNEILDVLGL